jgi:hypothetical protein
MRQGAITGFIISWIAAATAGAAAPYPLLDWRDADLEIGLTGAFRNERGVALAAVLEREVLFQGDGPRLTRAVLNAWGRTESVQTSSRLQRGIIIAAYKITPDGKAWFPGLPYHWKTTPERRPYVMVSPVVEAIQSIPEETRKRVYDQPIEVSKSLSDAEIVALVDFFWDAGVGRYEAPSSSGFGVTEDPLRAIKSWFDASGLTSFQNLSRIERASQVNAALSQEVGGVRGDDFALTLSRDGDGYDVIFLRKAGHEFKIVGTANAEF